MIFYFQFESISRQTQKNDFNFIMNDSSLFSKQIQYFILTVAYFSITYFLANEWASRQDFLPEMVATWEHYLPFWAWTLIPYFSLNLAYGLAFFLFKSLNDLKIYTKRLFWAQTVAVVCFVCFPLQMSWQKPELSGFFGFLLTILHEMDKPFNQAPSLHVALAWIVGATYFNLFKNQLIRILIVIWFALIALSVLTTYQHHFIDVWTGGLLGVLVWRLIK